MWRTDWSFVAVVVLCLGLASAVFVLRLLDRTPPLFDPVEHFLDGLYLLHDPSRSYLFERRANYPFLVSVVAIPFNLIGGYSYVFTTACIGAFFLVGSAVVTYLIGRELFGREGGVVAAALLALYPGVFGLALTYMLDLSLVFMLSLTFFFLLKSRTFRDRRYSLLTGAAIAIGSFTRFTFLLWVTFPVVIALGDLLTGAVAEARGHVSRLRRPEVSGRLWNAFGAGLIAAAIALPWYLPRLHFLLHDYPRIQERNNAAYGTNGTLFSWHSLAYYPRGLWHITSMPLLVLFVVCGALLFRHGRRLLRSPAALVVWWLVGGYLAATLPIRSDVRFLVPILPAVALASAGGLTEITSASRLGRWTGRTVAAVAVGFGVLQVYACTVGVRWLPAGPEVGALVERTDHPVWFSQRQEMLPRISRRGWNPDRVSAVVRRYAGSATVSVKVVGDSAATSMLRLPFVRADLIDAPPGIVFLDDDALASFPADFTIVEGASVLSARRALIRSSDVPGLAYRLLDREMPGIPEGQSLFVFERVH